MSTTAIVEADGPRAGGRAAVWIAVWLGLVLVGLNLVRDPTLADKTLVPRLHALLILLAAALPPLLSPRVWHRLDRAVLREPVVLCGLGAFAATALSFATAWNTGAVGLDLVRSGGFALLLVEACLLLPLLPRWSDHLVRALVVATLVTAGLGWYQLVSMHGIALHARRRIENVSGWMGNINFLASYLVFTLPICLAAVWTQRGPWRWLGGLTALSSLWLIVLLQSRSAFIGLAAGAVVGLLGGCLHAAALGVGPWFRRLALLAIVGAAAAGGVVFRLLPADHPLVVRLASIGQERRADGRLNDGGRFLIWRLTARLIADHPLAGVGAGNFPVRLPEYYASPGIDLAELSTDTWPDPHNDFLHVQAETGLPGLAAFAGLFLSALVSVRRTLRRPAPPAACRLALLISVSLVSYLAFSCFDFPRQRISHQAALAVLLAAAALLGRAPEAAHAAASPRARFVDRTARGGIVAAGLAVAAGLVWTSLALDQERSAEAARVAISERRWTDALGHARRASRPWRTLLSEGTPVAFLEGVALLQTGDPAAATARLEEANRHHPASFAVLNNLGIAYLGADRPAEALRAFARAVELHPHRSEGIANLAGLYLDVGRPRAALDLLERVPESDRGPAILEQWTRAREILRLPPDRSPASER